MKRICWPKHFLYGALLALGIMLWGSAALAQTVPGRSFNTFIYSDLVTEPSTVITFEPNGTLLMDIYEGVGLYLALGGAFAGVYWAPNYDAQDDLVLLLTGAVVTDFIGGIGVALNEYRFSEIFFYFGYAE